MGIRSPRGLGIEERQTHSLNELTVGAAGRFVRVSDSDPEMLRYLAEHGIALGDHLEVVDRQPFGGPVFVRFGDREQPIGGALARAMRIDTRRVGHNTAAPRSEPALQGAVEGASVALPGEVGERSRAERARAASVRGRVRATILMLGPAFVASIAYVDRATSPPTWKGARSPATCCCGSSFWRT